MSVKIRLQRHGKKQRPFYWIVAADARSKRDGKYLEKLGTYNPNTNPATVDLDIDKAVQWLHNGAQPTDTAKAILSYKGALLKHHLDGGIRKGALTQEQADAKLATWLEVKTGKVDAKKDGLSKVQQDAKAKALKAEKVANDKRASAAAEAVKVAETPEVTEEVVAKTEAAVVEETPEVVAETEAVVEETPEVVAETEAVVAETPEVVVETEAVVAETPEVVVETEAAVEEALEVVAETEAVVEEAPEVVAETEAVVEQTPAAEETNEEKEA